MNKRVFVYDGRQFDDPDPTLTPEEVKQNMSAFFPELSTADIREVKRAEETTAYEFVRKTGTKGVFDALTPAMVVAALQKVPEFHIDLIDLSWKFAKEDGSLDEEKMKLYRAEIDAAAEQANAYVESVRKTIIRLARFVGARPKQDWAEEV